ncbi:hypothetical protein GEV33_012040 [Tenebrio molitor]|uniref:Endonuclease/exonuclease/phosphatase domain-containing protein n=1 Tax=Tenebrio molitor TaxID=7067 RepID=A0A8J6HAI4_TENMO|nr:hypothetical protein GEV33_012040 [Tenebrio molitor]
MSETVNDKQREMEKENAELKALISDLKSEIKTLKENTAADEDGQGVKKIKNDIDRATTNEEIMKVALKDWPKNIYKVTAVVEGSPLASQELEDDIALITIGEEEINMDKGLYKAIKDRYPGIEKNREEELTCISQVTTMETSEGVETINKRYIYRVHIKEAKDNEVLNAMKKIKEAAKNRQRKIIAWPKPTGIDTSKEFVQDIEELLENNGKKKCIVAGDFNSKSKNWGSPRTDKRGEIVEEMIAAKQMVIANVGEEPTFVRGSQVSHLDITLHSEELAGKLKDWKVMDKETMSDHKYIIYKADTSKKNETRTTGKKKWVINDRNMKDLGANIQMTYWKYGKAIDTAEQLETIITEASDKTFTRGGGKGRRFQANYWWNEEIAQKRKACQALQRKIIRENKKYYKTRQGETLNKIQELKQEQNDNRKELRKAILASKKKKWKEITQELENDIWGKAYQIVTGKMKLRSKGELDTEEQIKIAKDLFPETAAIRWEAKEIETEEIPSLNAKELEAAAETMKRRKAPGPDQIPNEVVKAVVKEIPEEHGKSQG